MYLRETGISQEKRTLGSPVSLLAFALVTLALGASRRLINWRSLTAAAYSTAGHRAKGMRVLLTNLLPAKRTVSLQSQLLRAGHTPGLSVSYAFVFKWRQLEPRQGRIFLLLWEQQSDCNLFCLSNGFF